MLVTSLAIGADVEFPYKSCKPFTLAFGESRPQDMHVRNIP